VTKSLAGEEKKLALFVIYGKVEKGKEKIEEKGVKQRLKDVLHLS
jgi:hypothetical protein